jgi:Family of unknown function (DUF6069)
MAMTVEKPSFGAIFRKGGIAAVIAAVANLVVWFVSGLIAPNQIPLAPVAGVSILLILLGGLIYFALTRVTKSANTIFLIISVVFLIAFAFGPINAMSSPPVPGAEPFNFTTMIAAQVMHVVAGVLAIRAYLSAGK